MNRRKNMSNDWKEQKKRQKAIFTAQQNLPYEVKVRRAELRTREFIQESRNSWNFIFAKKERR